MAAITLFYSFWLMASSLISLKPKKPLFRSVEDFISFFNLQTSQNHSSFRILNYVMSLLCRHQVYPCPSLLWALEMQILMVCVTNYLLMYKSCSGTKISMHNSYICTVVFWWVQMWGILVGWFAFCPHVVRSMEMHCLGGKIEKCLWALIWQGIKDWLVILNWSWKI